MNDDRRLFWWILRAQLPLKLKLVLFTMALYGRGADDIRPGLSTVGHFTNRVQRTVRRHVSELVSLKLLLPQLMHKGDPTEYSLGLVALPGAIDHSIPPPDAIVSPKLLKLISHSTLEPHRKHLLWAIAMYGSQEVTKEQLARTLFRSTTEEAL